MVRFRITQRCACDDLGLTGEDATRNAENIAVKHEAIRVFVGKRSGAPGDGENVLNVNPYGHIKSLHVGQGRAATLYDDHAGVCWLLAYSDTHAVGERRDAYKHFERLDTRAELLPSENDYAALETVTSASLMDALRAYGAKLFDSARAEIGREVSTTFSLEDGQDVSITISIEIVIEETDTAEQGWISFVLPYDAPLGHTQLIDFVSDILPEHVDPDTISLAGDVKGRPVTHNELAFAWEHYSTA